MVRGNWQRRVELTASARQAYKLQKESRRNKQQRQQQQYRTSASSFPGIEDSYHRLAQWLDEKGDEILIMGRQSSDNEVLGANDVAPKSVITVDIWTHSTPTNRPEYSILEEHFEDIYCNDCVDINTKGGEGRGKGSTKKKTKGKSHPNAKNKSTRQEHAESTAAGNGISRSRDRSSSISSQNAKDETNTTKLCAREFFFGKEKCKGTQQFLLKKGGVGGGGRRSRSSSFGAEDDTSSNNDAGSGGVTGCCFRHYHQLPKNKTGKVAVTPTTTPPSPPMTLAQVLNEKFHSPQHYPKCSNKEDGDGNNISRDCIPENSFSAKPTVSLPVGVREATLKSSYEASFIIEEDCIESPSSSTTYIDMLYHTRFCVDNTTIYAMSGDKYDNVKRGSGSKSSDDDDNVYENAEHVDENPVQRSQIHEALQRIFNKYDIPSLASVVYLTIQGVLIFDRHRGGLVITEKEERFLLYGEVVVMDPIDFLDTSRKKFSSLDNDDDDGFDDSSMPIYERLTHNLLDEILSYSEDECVGILPRVCKSWYDEIGSPQLWSMMLERHGWPLSVNCNDDERRGEGGGGGDDDDADYCLPSSDEILHHCDQLRKDFISHYSVLRDVCALSNACTHIMGGGTGNKLGVESAMHIFKATKGSSINNLKENQCHVKIWPDEANKKEGAKARSLAAYDNCTLRLFEVVRGNNEHSANTQQCIKCRQIACLLVAPHFISRKKGRCKLMGMDLDDNVVACLVRGRDHDQPRKNYDNQWMTVISRDDIVCAGNEGLLEDCIQSHDLQNLILKYIYNELPPYLSDIFDRDDSLRVMVGNELIACGKGNFLISACISTPQDDDFGMINFGVEDEDVDINRSWRNLSLRGHRLFLFSTRTGSIVKSLVLERDRQITALFASRPFKRRSDTDGVDILCTTILISDPSMPLSLIAVEIRRDGTIDILRKAMIEEDNFAPWETMNAVLTSSHAVFSTDPNQGPALHIQGLHSNLNNGIRSFEIGEPQCKVRNIFIIREHYVAVVVHDNASEGVENELHGEWFGLNEAPVDTGASGSIIVYHIPSCNEICRFSLPSNALSIDCIGDTLAMNVSSLGFVMTGRDAREIGRLTMPTETMPSPTGKQPKGKKKRLVSQATGRKKDGFARGMSLRG